MFITHENLTLANFKLAKYIISNTMLELYETIYEIIPTIEKKNNYSKINGCN